MFIKKGQAKIIKNSRNEKTIEIRIKTYKGFFMASSPSGKSKGKNEVEEYNPRGIVWSRKLAEVFLKKIEGKNLSIENLDDLKEFEKNILSFESNFGELGGNVVYSLETAILKAAAKEKSKELWELIAKFSSNNLIKMPLLVGNCVGGGLHSTEVEGKKPDFQEFLLIPKERNISKSVTKNIHAYFYVKKLLSKKQGKIKTKPNDESAWRTKLANEEVLNLLEAAAKKYGLKIGIDMASSTFFSKNGYYEYKNKKLVRDRTEQEDYSRILIKKYGLFYVEDPLHEEDFSGFTEILSQINSKKTLIVGDDLTTTNLKRVERAIRANAVNAVIIKPNQIGSLVETAKVFNLCKKNNIKTIFYHSSGETMDDALADLAVGFGADFVKTGIYGRERLIKLKRLIEIEKNLYSKHFN